MLIQEELIHVNGHELLLRSPREEDAELLLHGLKALCEETRFLLKEPEEITLTTSDEVDFIQSQTGSDTDLMILGFWDGAYVGSCSLTGKAPTRQRHRAEIGIALYQAYTGLGIGRLMLERLIAAAKGMGFEQLELEVMANNRPAISLYQKLGFTICGTFPNNAKYKDGTYADAHWMMKRL